MPTNTCSEIDELLDSLSRLAASGAPPEKFYEQLLLRGIHEAQAIGGAIWAGRDCLVERFADDMEGQLHSGSCAGCRELLAHVIEHGESEAAIIEHADRDGTLCPLRCILAPFFVEGEAAGGMEFLLPIAAPESEQDRVLRLAEAFAELIADYHCRRQLAGYRRRDVHWKSLSRFLDSIHRADLHETAMATANEGRWFVGCDRVSVIVKRQARCKALAISGVDRIESRSNLVTRLEELAAAILETGESLWAVDERATKAPQSAQPLQNFLEVAHPRSIVVLPLGRATSAVTDGSTSSDRHEPHPFGVLVFEWFTAPAIDETIRERIDLVSRHGALALDVALATERLPLIACNRALAKIAWLASAQQLPAKLWAAGILAVLALALVFVPADFEVAADGELQPVVRREIFAPADAVVDAVHIEHGENVKAGQPLLHLRSSALEFEAARLQGEIQTAESRLAAIRSARLDRYEDQAGPALRRLQLSAEEEELKVSLASLRRQEQLVIQQRDELEVRSPIDGQVLTWDVGRCLTARPVERGQPLVSVGDVAGRWSLELGVSDRQIGYVLDAAEQAYRDGEALPVSFLLNAEPSAQYRGHVERIARRGQIDEITGEPVVRVIVRFDEHIENPRPGAGVVAKIDCGQRSLGFVLLHDAWNSVRRRLLF